jgi:hypothetical protein
MSSQSLAKEYLGCKGFPSAQLRRRQGEGIIYFLNHTITDDGCLDRGRFELRTVKLGCIFFYCYGNKMGVNSADIWVK